MTNKARRKCVRAFVVAGVVCLASLAAVAPASADDSQSVVATDGWLAQGVTGAITDTRAGTFSFNAAVIVPQGSVEATGSPGNGEIDLRQPMVSFTESRNAPSGWQDTACSVLRNVSPEIAASVRVGQVPDFYVDVECADGRGYDFYRMHWKGTERVDWGSSMTTVPMYRQAGWGPVHPFNRPHYTGSAEWATFRTDSRSNALFSVCGYRWGQADCLIPEGRTDPWQHAVINGGWTSITVKIGWTDRPRTCC